MSDASDRAVQVIAAHLAEQYRDGVTNGPRQQDFESAASIVAALTHAKLVVIRKPIVPLPPDRR